MEAAEESFADADLKEHNIIDSVTYVYGFNNCHGVRNEWMVLVSQIIVNQYQRPLLDIAFLQKLPYAME